MTSDEWDVAELSEAAWVDFEKLLMAYVEEVPIGAILRFDMPVMQDPEGGCAPWVQVLKGADSALVQVPGNDCLAPAYALELTQEQQLFAWGFARPGTPVDFPLAADQAAGLWSMLETAPGPDPEIVASAAIAVLREIFGVIEPALMNVSGSDDDGAWQRLVVLPPDDEESDSADAPFPIARPDDPVQLRALIGEVLAGRAEHVSIDDDEDHVLHHSLGPVWVRARTDEPTVDIFARVVSQVRSRRQAAVELAILNRGHAKAKFQLFDRAVFQTMALPAMPFVGEHLWSALEEFLIVFEAVRDDLSLRTGGVR